MTKTQLNFLLAASALAAILASWLRLDAVFTLLKPLTTILIILVPVLFSAKNTYWVVAATIIALGFCLLGDLFLLNEDFFVYGLSAFLVAHALFIIIFFQLSDRRIYPPVLFVMMVIGGGIYLMLFPKLGELAIPVAFYTGFIMAMCWRGVSLWLARRDKSGRYLCIAAILFVFSDFIIAVNKFIGPFDLSNAVILTSYWSAIAIIANVVPTTKPWSKQ
ncbi:MAG: lysoplasmalogenase [Gammaproteobacteria bacterium]|nr:lysoplasmalogenase [Gammaproteobacteria bacterium]